jgi:hypothetical protein
LQDGKSGNDEEKNIGGRRCVSEFKAVKAGFIDKVDGAGGAIIPFGHDKHFDKNLKGFDGVDDDYKQGDRF